MVLELPAKRCQQVHDGVPKCRVSYHGKILRRPLSEAKIGWQRHPVGSELIRGLNAEFWQASPPKISFPRGK